MDSPRNNSKSAKQIFDRSAELSSNLESYNKKQFDRFPWPDGNIYYAYDFYTFNVNRMRDLVEKAHRHLEVRTCIKFIEDDPRVLAKTNMTYIQYSYSEALENCCLPFFNKQKGRRMVLITPMCSVKNEVAHAIFHGFGFRHKKGSPFPDLLMKDTLYMNTTDCPDREDKIKNYWMQ